MISTRGSRPSFFTLAAASQIARTCIAYRPGLTMPSRTPRRPSIGFASWSSFTFCSTRFCSDDVLAALLAERDLDGQTDLVRQELVQRRVQEPHRHRKTAHGAEDADEVLALEREQDVVRGLLLGLGLREDHLLHGLDALRAQEHVLGAAQTDALGAALARVRRLVGRVGVRAHAHAPDRRPPEPSTPRTPSRSSARALRRRPAAPPRAPIP